VDIPVKMKPSQCVLCLTTEHDGAPCRQDMYGHHRWDSWDGRVRGGPQQPRAGVWGQPAPNTSPNAVGARGSGSAQLPERLVYGEELVMSSPRLSDTLEAKFRAAEAALFALEEALGASGTPDRQAVYRVRCSLGEAHHAIRVRRHGERDGN